MFLQNFPQECLDEVWVAHLRSQDADPLFYSWEPRTLPYPLCNPLQLVTRWWPNSSGVPDLSLANVDVDSGMPVQLFVQDVVNRSHLVWRGRDVHVIQTSPCSPPSPDECGGRCQIHLPTNAGKVGRRKSDVGHKEVDLGEPTSFLDQIHLGCTQRQ